VPKASNRRPRRSRTWRAGDRSEEARRLNGQFTTLSARRRREPSSRSPDDRCQSPHWLRAPRGRGDLRYADREETYNAGEPTTGRQAHPPGQGGPEIVEFSPTRNTADASSAGEELRRLREADDARLDLALRRRSRRAPCVATDAMIAEIRRQPSLAPLLRAGTGIVLVDTCPPRGLRGVLDGRRVSRAARPPRSARARAARTTFRR